MKFKFKVLAAALALAAAIPAQAAIDSALTGNSSFVLTVFDKIANVQASFDLGQNYADFNQNAAAGTVTGITNPGTVFTWDLASNLDYSSAWSSFIGAATLPNIQYAVTAADFTVPNAAGQRGYITTLKTPAAAALTNSGMITAISKFNDYTANENFFGHTAANGSLFTANATTASNLYNFNRVGGSTSGPLTVGNIGDSLGVVQMAYAGTNTFATTSTTVFGNGANFTLANNGSLTYSVLAAPVPEADSWAMMLLGLGFMGFIARRKQA